MWHGGRTTKKVTPVLGGFDSANYKTERQWATAEDGTRVPFSFVYRKGVARLDGTDPVLLNGYVHASSMHTACSLLEQSKQDWLAAPGAPYDGNCMNLPWPALCRYGSYEICNDPYFARDKLSLIDRGFIFAMAHIRGGGEMGRQWYEQVQALLGT